ncbi:DgyrCDS13401 [Dimorphilus gyrociliatus]|uniref:Protein CNPPD1 n=1 Tax=Dimorphilus gyrociliatus TaxID=2664684 RepID=A0A7I8WAJ5_9ANNE|nr:DgyrCDS13401 [Dimorphilus gyrociliatus]
MILWKPIEEKATTKFKVFKRYIKDGNAQFELERNQTGYFIKCFTVYYLSKFLYNSFSQPLYIEAESHTVDLVENPVLKKHFKSIKIERGETTKIKILTERRICKHGFACKINIYQNYEDHGVSEPIEDCIIMPINDLYLYFIEVDFDLCLSKGNHPNYWKNSTKFLRISTRTSYKYSLEESFFEFLVIEYNRKPKKEVDNIGFFNPKPSTIDVHLGQLDVELPCIPKNKAYVTWIYNGDILDETSKDYSFEPKNYKWILRIKKCTIDNTKHPYSCTILTPKYQYETKIFKIRAFKPVKILTKWPKYEVHENEAKVSLFCEAVGSKFINVHWQITRNLSLEYQESTSGNIFRIYEGYTKSFISLQSKTCLTVYCTAENYDDKTNTLFFDMISIVIYITALTLLLVLGYFVAKGRTKRVQTINLPLSRSSVLSHALSQRTLKEMDTSQMARKIFVDALRETCPKTLGFLDIANASKISRDACMSPCSMMLGMIYIERLKKSNKGYLKSITGSELFLISMMVASKYSFDQDQDEAVFNGEWAESGDLETSEINDLEREFLTAINWNLFIERDDFYNTLSKLEYLIACKQGRDRGYWTYTDLSVILENFNLAKYLSTFTSEMFKVLIAISLSYVIGVTAIAASLSATLVISQALKTNETGTFNSLPSTIKYTIDRFYNKDERFNFRCNPGCCSQEHQSICRNVTKDTSATETESNCLNELDAKNIENGFCCCCKETLLVQSYGNLERSIFNLHLGFSTGPGLNSEQLLVK